MKSLSLFALFLGLLAAPLPTLAGKAHVHGAAKLDIAVDAKRITARLDTPLDNLVGFERAPRTDAERQRVEAALARLRAGDELFKFDSAAGCRMAKVEIQSAVLKLGQAAAAPSDGHADLEAEWAFDCSDAAKATSVEVGLFSFKSLKSLAVQVATPRTQFKRDLNRPNQRIPLAP